MKRKVIRQGHNTLTMSLPIKWCESHSLKGGEEIEISEKGEHLLISKESFRGSGSVNIDITGLDRSTIIMLLESFYIYGYDTINITTKDSKAKWIMCDQDWSINQIMNYTVNLMIGAEMVASGKGKNKIEVLTEDSKEKFEITLRRIFRLVIGLFETYLEGVKTKQKNLEAEIDLQHFNIMKFANYALRLLNKFGYEEADKTTYYYSIINFLTKAERVPKNIAGYTIQNINLSKKGLELVEEIFNGFEQYYEVFYKYDLKKIAELTANRDRFKNRFLITEFKNLTKDDVFIVSYMAQIYDMILDLIEIKMAIEK